MMLSSDNPNPWPSGPIRPSYDPDVLLMWPWTSRTTGKHARDAGSQAPPLLTRICISQDSQHQGMESIAAVDISYGLEECPLKVHMLKAWSPRTKMEKPVGDVLRSLKVCSQGECGTLAHLLSLLPGSNCEHSLRYSEIHSHHDVPPTLTRSPNKWD